MKITWYIAVGVRNCGGVAIIYNFANKMYEIGHDVKVVIGSPNNFTWFSLKPEIIYNPNKDEDLVPDSDIVIFSNTKSAEIIDKLSERKGIKFQYIQDYEVWANTEEQIWLAWSLPINKLVAANYLKENMLKNTGHESKTVHYGIDFDVFYNIGIRDENKFVVGALYNPMARKRFEDTLEVYKRVKKKYSDIKLVLFGTEERPDFDIEFEYYKKPSKDKLREIYSRTHVWIAMSEQEGLHIPPMEAMSCGAVLVVTNIGGMKDYAIHKKTAFTVNVGDIDEAAKYVLNLYQDRELLNGIRRKSLKHIRAMGSRDENVKKMLDIFEKSLKNRKKSSSEIKKNISDNDVNLDFDKFEGKRVCFYSASIEAKDYIVKAMQYKFKDLILVDRNKFLQGISYCGLKIQNPDVLKENKYDYIIIISRWNNDIKTELKDRYNIDEGVIIPDINWSER